MTDKSSQNELLKGDESSLPVVESEIRLEDALCFNLYTASRLMTQAYAEHLKEVDLTYPQFLVMNLLWAKNKLTLKSIGERLYLDSGTLTPLMNRLVDLGYVKKEKSADDDREILVNLTVKGRNLKKKCAAVPMLMFCKLDVSMERFVEIRNGVNEILNNLKKQKAKIKKQKG